MNPYHYESSKQVADLRLKKDTPRSLHYTVEFPSAVNTGYVENGVVRGEYYWPKVSHKTPLAILAHGMGDVSMIPCKLLARALLKQGIACFLPYLTVHSTRIPKAMREHFPYLTPDEWFLSYRLSVIDIRQIIDWADSRTELDRDRIAAVGISFGGFISAIAMGIDSRIKAGVFITTGGNSEKMNRLGKAAIYRKGYERTEAEHHDIESSYASYLAEVAEKGFENVVPERQSFLNDPLTFATYLKGRPVLMINALKDKYIPREAATELWQASGQPPIKWIPSGHSTIWLWYPVIRRDITAFLKSSFTSTNPPAIT